MAFDAITALNQLTLSHNGASRLKIMIGAKSFFTGDDFVGFRFMRGAKNKANYIKITLAPSDTYTVEFGYIRGVTRTIRSTTEGLYFEDLKGFFEAETSLYLSL